MSEDDDLKKHWDALTAGGLESQRSHRCVTELRGGRESGELHRPAFIKDSISQFTFKVPPLPIR